MNDGGTGSPPRVIGERYTLLDLLGSGLMGQVYRAHDAELGRDVALKILRDPEDLLGLKHEFRSLADLRHPNLVALHELVVAPELSFLTMELVSGVDLVSWARTPAEGRFDRLREALPQLLDGLEALHVAGRFHRDIKPSNILVTAERRVVLVDFGLAFTRPLLVSRRGDETGFAGTPDYMAPEQLWGAPPSSASDAYALGATLFEALTGELPFRGDVQALANRARGAGPSPRERDPSVPADLDELVRSLLETEPARRPAIDAMRRSIGAPGSRAELLPSSASVWEAPFVDREEPIAALVAALEEVRAGSAVAIRIEGPSGIGKSALVRHFVASIPEPERIVVLAGRCYPQESVPFKALDPLVDALSGFLERLDGEDLGLVLPEHGAALLRLFPVLGRCVRLREIADRSVLPPEPDEIRRAGFAELLELLRRVSARFTLLLWIDDLQWGDSDSAIFLRGLASSREAPPLLLLLTHRGAEWEMSAMRAALVESGGQAFARTIELAPLPATDARALARDLVSRVDTSPSPTLDEIVREAGGNPFLVCELARHCAARVGGATAPLPVGVTEIVAERVRRIDEGARRLLSVVAVAGGPCRDPRPRVRRASRLASMPRSGSSATSASFVIPPVAARNSRRITIGFGRASSTASRPTSGDRFIFRWPGPSSSSRTSTRSSSSSTTMAVVTTCAPRAPRWRPPDARTRPSRSSKPRASTSSRFALAATRPSGGVGIAAAPTRSRKPDGAATRAPRITRRRARSRGRGGMPTR